MGIVEFDPDGATDDPKFNISLDGLLLKKRNPIRKNAASAKDGKLGPRTEKYPALKVFLQNFLRRTTEVGLTLHEQVDIGVAFRNQSVHHTFDVEKRETFIGL